MIIDLPYRQEKLSGACLLAGLRHGSKVELETDQLQAHFDGAAVPADTSRRLNRHDPYLYLNDVLTRLPRQWEREFGQLLPHK